MTNSPVARLTPPPQVYCDACETPMLRREPGTTLPQHLEASWTCQNPECQWAGVCRTCARNETWIILADRELGPDPRPRL